MTARSFRSCIALITTLGFACPANDDEVVVPNDHAGPCTDLEFQAGVLVHSAKTCTSDAECIFVSFDVGCLVPFLCQGYFNADTDFESLERRAQDIADSYQQQNCDCAIANCAPQDPMRIYCDVSTKRCRTDGLPSDDADGG